MTARVFGMAEGKMLERPVLVDDEQRALVEFNRKPLAQQAMIVANLAYSNEKATRARVEALEGAFNALGERTLWGRVKWLLAGR